MITLFLTNPLTATLLSLFPTTTGSSESLPATQPFSSLATQVADEFVRNHQTQLQGLSIGSLLRAEGLVSAADLRDGLTELVEEIVPLARPEVLLPRLLQVTDTTTKRNWPAAPIRKSLLASLESFQKLRDTIGKTRGFAEVDITWPSVAREQYVRVAPNLWAGLAVMAGTADDSNNLLLRVMVEGLEVWPGVPKRSAKARLVMLAAEREFQEDREYFVLRAGVGLYSPGEVLRPLIDADYLRLVHWFEEGGDFYEQDGDWRDSPKDSDLDPHAAMSFEAAYRVLQPALGPLLQGEMIV